MSQMVGPQRHQAVVPNGLKPFVLREVPNEDNNIEVGYYLHRKKLGEGGFGKVKLATHLKTGHKVAVKIMNKLKLGSDLHRVITEIKALKVLRHENIAKLFQVIETQTEIYLILEYCSGGELFDYLVSHKRLTESEAKIIMRDLANALSFIHRNGFAHRDLKPENILFDANHRIKLIDFGLAANCRDNKSTLNHLKTCCGSPAYAAPELLQGPHYSGPAVDVWSAGILLFALLVGRLPFDDENISSLYKKIQSGFYRIPDYLSNDAKDLIHRMLRTNPEDRITIDQMLLHPWLKGLSESGNSLKPLIKPNFDESVFFECSRLFRGTPIKSLRESIVHGSGYQSATYWLIKMNGPPVQNISAIKSPPIKTQNRRRSKSISDLVNNENEDSENLKSDQKYKPMDMICERKVARRALWSPKLTPNSPQSKIPVLLSPKPQKLQEIKSPNNSPLIPPKRARIADNKTAIGSPFRLHTSCTKTPIEPILEATPKKSLFKRFLETATPAKSQNPRSITTSSATKNITLTKYSEPQKLIEKLIQTLTARGITCRQKDFSLRCVLTTNNVIILSFSLEICKYENRCVIQRKRLKGDAWNYKRVCEEILRISNE